MTIPASSLFGDYPAVHEIIPGLWLGELSAAENERFLSSVGIQSVLSILGRSTFHVPVLNHLFIRHMDGLRFPEEKIASGVTFIHQRVEKDEPVLVHCRVGVSRSVTMVSAYLMRHEGLNPWEALNFIQQKREIIDPQVNTYTSAIQWRYGHNRFYCSSCLSEWQYRRYKGPAQGLVGELCDCPTPHLEVMSQRELRELLDW